MRYNSRMANKTTSRKNESDKKGKTEFRPDLLWKELLESFLYSALEIFYPMLYAAIDLRRRPVLLNKELRVPGAHRGQRIVDLLVDIPLKSGNMTCVLLHVE
ncbi:MAG: hypothetical protein LBQ90_13300, partial [Synergistaceae bacterium]|nr:hypothetical protein [Synergistaceae bacterium]